MINLWTLTVGLRFSLRTFLGMVMEAERLSVEWFGLHEVDVGRPVAFVCEGPDLDRDGDCCSGEVFLAARAAPLLVVLRVVVRLVLEGRVVTGVVSGANSSSGGRGPTGSSAAEKQKVPHY